MHLRQVLGILGVLVMGGEAYISFKPGLVDANGTISDENTRTFLQAFIKPFSALLAGGRLEAQPARLRHPKTRYKRGYHHHVHSAR
jgi:hypothetical protein